MLQFVKFYKTLNSWCPQINNKNDKFCDICHYIVYNETPSLV